MLCTLYHFDKKVSICVMGFKKIKRIFMILVLLSLFMIVGFALRCAEFCYVKRNLRAKDVTL